MAQSQNAQFSNPQRKQDDPYDIPLVFGSGPSMPNQFQKPSTVNDYQTAQNTQSRMGTVYQPQNNTNQSKGIPGPNSNSKPATKTTTNLFGDNEFKN